MQEYNIHKISKKEYEFCAEVIWGCIPPQEWGTESKLYQEKSKELLEKFPKLWIDFFKK